MIKHRLVVALLAMSCLSLNAMVYDNRFLPLLQKPLFRNPDARAQMMIQPFAFIGDNTVYEDLAGENQPVIQDNEIPLFNINGPYNELGLYQTMLRAGLVTPSIIRSDLPTMFKDLNWSMNGIIRAQGLGFTYFQQFNRHISWGFNFFFARLESALDMEKNLNDFATVAPADFTDLFEANNALQDKLGLYQRIFNTVGVSDVEAYLRFGILDDYKYKFKHIDFGVNVGLIFPAAQKINYCNPASIPLGGNGHWGMFVAFDGQFELKQNWGTGLLLRIQKRFSQIFNRRMVQDNEPNNYGVIFGKSEVDPGVTVVFSPYIALERLRSGFGLGVQYTMVYHAADDWTDLRTGKNIRPANDALLESRSEWASEYVTASAFYDFSKDSKERTFQPIINFAVDIPVTFLVAKRYAKTFGISLTVESTLW